MSSYRIISADNHITEPPELWVSRAEPKFKDRVPQVHNVDGSDAWICEGKSIGGVGGGSGDIGRRFEDPGSMGLKLGEHRKGGWIPEEHVKDLDIDGVDVSIIYPTVASLLYNVKDSELLDSICRTYNDWVGEFCAAFPKRLKGIAMLNVDDVGVGVKELERAHKLGFVGAMIPCYPPEDRLYDQPMYDPLWAAAQGLGMPLGLHISSNRNDSEFASLENYRPTFICNADYWPRMSLTDLIFGGVFEKYPGLQVGSVEHELSWAPHFLDRIDYTYTQRSGGLDDGPTVQGRHASQRLLPQQRVPWVPGRRPRREGQAHNRGGQPAVGVGLSPLGGDLPPEPPDNRGGTGGLYGGGEGEDSRRQRGQGVSPGLGFSNPAGPMGN